jgi:two-component system sensor histidine kinase QseC
LNGLFGRIRDTIQRERNFTSNAAHELRTPLTVIATHLQVARLCASEAETQALLDATTGVERMRGTLDQLLMLARIEGHVSFDDGEHVTASMALERAVAMAHGDASERIVKAAQAGDTNILDIPPQLAVVALRNLIDNALRYSPPDSPVQVGFHVDSAFIRFFVADLGPGMVEAEAHLATRRFWRGMMSHSGSGLGLSIVEAIANRFGGSFALGSRQPCGLVAELVLPVLELPTTDAPSST